MDQKQINEVTSHRHLGIIFSSDCTWHEHLEQIKTKAWARINVMRKLKFKLDRKSLQTIYFSFTRPLIEYADVEWNNCTQYEVNELEKIQNEAARIVTGATKLVSINSLLTEIGWETLATRRKQHKLTLFYKMQNDLLPEYLASLVPPTVGSTSSYPLRNSNDLHILHTNSQLYYNSFLPSPVREWNELPEQTRDSASLNIFKTRINPNTEKRTMIARWAIVPSLLYAIPFIASCVKSLFYPPIITSEREVGTLFLINRSVDLNQICMDIILGQDKNLIMF